MKENDNFKTVGIEANGITEIILTRIHVRETQCGVRPFYGLNHSSMANHGLQVDFQHGGI